MSEAHLGVTGLIHHGDPKPNRNPENINEQVGIRGRGYWGQARLYPTHKGWEGSPALGGWE